MNLHEVPWRTNIRGEGVLAARNDRMLVERTREFLRRLSRNNYGNHYETRFSHHRCCFLRRPFRFHSRLRYCTTIPVPLYPLLSPTSFSRPFMCFHTAEGGARVHARADTWESERSWAFVQFRSLSEPRGHCVPHCRSSSRLFSPWNYHFLVLSAAREYFT